MVNDSIFADAICEDPMLFSIITEGNRIEFGCFKYFKRRCKNK